MYSFLLSRIHLNWLEFGRRHIKYWFLPMCNQSPTAGPCHITKVSYLNYRRRQFVYWLLSLGPISCLPHNHDVTSPKILHCNCIGGYLCDICHHLLQLRCTCSRVSPHPQRIATSEFRWSRNHRVPTESSPSSPQSNEHQEAPSIITSLR